MDCLIIYDESGFVLNTTYGAVSQPKNIKSMIVDIPEGEQVVNVDVSTPDDPKVVTESMYNSEYLEMKGKIDELTFELEQANEVNTYLSVAASFAASSFTDEQALQVPLLYPFWSSDSVNYKTGDRVRYTDNVLYKVLQDHTSQESWTPDNSPSLFAKVLIEDPSVIPEWEQPGPENAYKKGDHVMHNGKEWESLVDNNVWEPGVIGTEGQWKEVIE